MIEQGALQTVYILFAFAVQIILIADFAARVWKSALELRWGWLIYTLVGVAGLLLGVLLVVSRQPAYLAAGPLLLAIWAAVGYTVDVWRPVNWRSPPRWRIFIPYVGLYVTALLVMWVSMWFIGLAYWIAFGAMYAVHTGLNIYSHFKTRETGTV
ncbi:MAG TPA: hypothetical protein VFL17_03250 [Anaerolineae bacterium]|nr:hypothetical protein [Anaerolineae bacterium]